MTVTGCYDAGQSPTNGENHNRGMNPPRKEFSMNTLIRNANNHRHSVINGMYNAVISGKDIDTEPLKEVAKSPRSLGFSDHDLKHFIDGSQKRAFELTEKIRQINVRINRTGSTNKVEQVRKNALSLRASAYSAISKALTEELKGRHPYVVPVKTEVVEQPAQAVAVEVINLKAISTRARKLARKYKENVPFTGYTVKSFEELAESLQLSNSLLS